MSDFNGFQTAYQPNSSYYYQPKITPGGFPATTYPTQWSTTAIPSYMQQQPQQQLLNGSMNWVQGEAGARAFSNLQPGIPVALWDSEDQVIYIKTIDNTGKPSMTILDYTERGASKSKQVDVSSIEYATKDQFESLNGQYSSISNQIEKLANHIDEIENRITSFGKPQQTNRRGNNK